MTASTTRPQAVVYDETKFPDAPSTAIRYKEQVAEAKGNDYAETLEAFAFLVDIAATHVPEDLEDYASSRMGVVGDALGMNVEEVSQFIELVVQDQESATLRNQLLGKQH